MPPAITRRGRRDLLLTIYHLLLYRLLTTYYLLLTSEHVAQKTSMCPSSRMSLAWPASIRCRMSPDCMTAMSCGCAVIATALAWGQ